MTISQEDSKEDSESEEEIGVLLDENELAEIKAAKAEAAAQKKA
jgi:hypothetical protein